MNKMYIYKETTNERSYLIAIKRNNDSLMNIASFDNMDQLEFFRNTLGFNYELFEIINEGTEKELKIFNIDSTIIDSSFWKVSEIPEGSKPLKVLSNGSIVTGYYSNKDGVITIYRPNPNAKDVYKPLETSEHIAHKRIYGTY